MPLTSLDPLMFSPFNLATAPPSWLSTAKPIPRWRRMGGRSQSVRMYVGPPNVVAQMACSEAFVPLSSLKVCNRMELVLDGIQFHSRLLKQSAAQHGKRGRERERPQKVLNLVVLFDNGCAIGHSRGPLDLPMRPAMIGYLRWNIRNISPSQCGVER